MAETTNAGAATTTQQNGAAGANATAADWLTGVDGEGRGLAEIKAWNGPGDVIRDYRQLEKFRGVPAERLLTLPERLDDAAALGPIYDRLGRPKDVAGYGIENGDPEFLAEIHKAGLTHGQVKALYGVLNSRSAAAKEAADRARDERIGQELAELQREWGATYQENENFAKRGAQMLGWDEATLTKLEDALGTKAVFQLAARIGRGFGEGKFVEGDNDRAASGGGFGMTRDAARAAYDRLNSDPSFLERFTSANKAVREAAVAEKAKLSALAFGD